ncbi:MAG: acyltransferase 3 [Modestobacter sp.]|nr:acyltransferase 3 [Modestobacter sp.]MCW2509656.1 acyltransferase 3 [Modestobacter sp.]
MSVSPPPHGAQRLAAATRTVRASGEIRALTGLRFVAAVWVILVHFQIQLSGVFGDYLAPVRPVLTSGWLGVDLFFLLSGFVMVLSYGESMGRRFHLRDALVFLWARLSRIWPLWALLTVVMFGFLGATGASVSVGGLVEQLLLVQMWHRDVNLGSSFIAPGWSLSVELVAYVAFPVLVLVFWRLRRLPAVVLAALAVAAMSPLALLAYQTGESNWQLPWPLRIAGAFISGGLTCLFVERVKAHPAAGRIGATVSVVAVLEILGVCFWSAHRVQSGGIDQVAIAIVFFPVLVGSLALSSGGLARVLSSPALVLGGRISFAMYLVHLCVADAVVFLGQHVATFAAGTPGSELLTVHLIPLTIAVAYLLWRFVEEPGRRFMRDRCPVRRRPALAVAPAEQRRPAAALLERAASYEPPTTRLAVPRHERAVPGRPTLPPPRSADGQELLTNV